MGTAGPGRRVRFEREVVDMGSSLQVSVELIVRVNGEKILAMENWDRDVYPSEIEDRVGGLVLRTAHGMVDAEILAGSVPK